MIDLSAVEKTMSDDLNSVTGFVNSMYDKNFAAYFTDSREVFARMNSKVQPITDEELNYVLIDLPLRLIDVSEQLSTFKMRHETMKISVKQKENELAAEAKDNGLKGSEAKDYVISNSMEDKLLLSAYAAVIYRVESEIAFCRELIMGAKKIWDARRKSESVNPVAEVNDSPDGLPEYSYVETESKKKKTYIKGADS